MVEPPRTSYRLEALLSGLALLIPAGLLVGSSFGYAVHAIAFGVACVLLARSPDWRSRTSVFFTNCPGIWGLTVAFAIVFSLPFLFSRFSTPGDVSELKWVLVWLALLMPAAALYRSGGAGRPVRIAASVLIGIILLSAVNGAVHFLSGANFLRELTGSEVDEFGGRRATGLLRNPIPFSHAMGVLFWVAAAGFLVSVAGEKKRLMLLALVVGGSAFSGVLLSQTRGAWLAVAAVTICSFPLVKGKARTWWLIALGAAGLVGLTAVAFHAETRERLISGFDPSQTSNRLRLELWQANLEILKDHPFGIGYNANDQLIGETFDELGFERHPWMGHSHNEFVEIAVGSGWLGLLFYGGLTAWLFLRTLRAFREAALKVEPWTSFLLLSSMLVQLFINACALTDQMSTPGRYLLCLAWAIAVVVPVERSRVVR